MRLRLMALLLLPVLVACGSPTDNSAPATGANTTAPSAASAADAVDPNDPAVRDGMYSALPEMTVDPNKSYTATIETTAGTMVADLYPQEAPVAVNNFVFLARENFYQNVKFHRIIDGFMVQTGDPTGTGRGGPGYDFEIERPTKPQPYALGTIAMANNGRNGSQFFIINTEDINQKLQPNYSILGQVTEGLDVLEKISQTPVTTNPQTGEPSMPTEDVRITNVTISEQ